MRVKCVLCDKIENINTHSPLAKKLRNRPIHTYLCNNCYERVKIKTEARLATGNFKLYRDKQDENDW